MGFFTDLATALDAGFAAALAGGLPLAGTALPLAAGVRLVAGAAFFRAGLVAVLALTTALTGAAFFTAGLALSATLVGAFEATALTDLAGVAAFPAFGAMALALVTATPFLVLAVVTVCLLSLALPPMGGCTAGWLGMGS